MFRFPNCLKNFTEIGATKKRVSLLPPLLLSPKRFPASQQASEQLVIYFSFHHEDTFLKIKKMKI